MVVVAILCYSMASELKLCLLPSNWNGLLPDHRHLMYSHTLQAVSRAVTQFLGFIVKDLPFTIAYS